MGLEINMASNGSNNIRVGIDIGTSKVVCLIAEYVDHELRVIGLGSQTSQGLKNGVIVDFNDTQKLFKNPNPYTKSLINASF